MTLRLILAMVFCSFTLLAQTSPPLAEVRKAAEQGDATAQAKMGRAYFLGLGVPKDATEALKWYRKAAEQGEPNAQATLGFMYEMGRGVAQDYSEALGWYRKAAEQGNAIAQFNLGLMCANGKGVTQDYVEAYMWLNLAASNLSGEEQKRLASVQDALAKKMTSQQIVEAGRRAQEWKQFGPAPLGSTSPGAGSTENAGSAYRAPSPGAAQVSSSTAQDKVPLIGQATSVAPQEPPTLGELFRIDQATGTPTPLERVEVKKVPINMHKVEFGIAGSASPVSFKAGEPLQFAIRLVSPGDRNDGELDAKEVQRHIRLGRLAVQHFKKGDERILTLGAIGLNVETYGQLTRGFDPRKPDLVAQSFRLTPQIALTPGQYHIWIDGMHELELHTGAHFVPHYYGRGSEHWAFEIH